MAAIRDCILNTNHKPPDFFADRHTAYMLSTFAQFLEEKEIRAPNTATAAKHCEGEDDWVSKIPRVTRAYSTSIHPATGFSPYFMLYFRVPDREIDKGLPLLEKKSRYYFRIRDHQANCATEALVDAPQTDG